MLGILSKALISTFFMVNGKISKLTKVIYNVHFIYQPLIGSCNIS